MAIGWVILQVVVGIAGVAIAWALLKASESRWRTALLALMLAASAVIGISAILPWLYAPAVAVLLLLSLTYLVVALRAKPRNKLLLSGLMVGLSGVAIVSMFINPPMALEFALKLIEPKYCVDDLASVHTFIPLPDDTPELYENIVALDDGSFIVVAASRGELLHVSEAGEVRVFSKLPTGVFDLTEFEGMVSGVSRGLDDAIYTMVIASDPANRGIWRVDSAGNPTLWSHFPVASGGNGMATDRAGNIFVADSSLGLIWKTGPDGGEPVVWADDDLLGTGEDSALPAANGIKIAADGTVFVTTTLPGRVVRVAVNSDGSAGEITEWDSGISGDDFDIDSRGRLYVTTHPFNTVVRLESGQACAVVGNAGMGIVGPTAAVFGARAEDSSVLYVVNDGGYMLPLRGAGPSIVGLDLSE